MNLRRYYNQNRKKIWGILIIIAFALLMFYLMNYVVNQTKDNNTDIMNNKNEAKINTNSSTITTNESVITGEKKQTEELEDAVSTIDEFVSYCNNKDLQSAYELLTDECKTQVYNSVGFFEEAYYNDVFNGEEKTCSIENWIGDTYKVRIIDNLLASGKSNNGYAKQDYITVKKVGDSYKLNIGNYIGYEEIGEETEQYDIKIIIVGKNIYMDHEEYTVRVKNDTGKQIKLDGKTNVKSVYLQDSEGAKHSFYSHELTDPMLMVQSGQTKDITIKFYNSYTSSRNIEYMIFSDVIIIDGQLTDKKEIRVKI